MKLLKTVVCAAIVATALAGKNKKNKGKGARVAEEVETPAVVGIDLRASATEIDVTRPLVEKYPVVSGYPVEAVAGTIAQSALATRPGQPLSSLLTPELLESLLAGGKNFGAGFTDLGAGVALTKHAFDLGFELGVNAAHFAEGDELALGRPLRPLHPMGSLGGNPLGHMGQQPPMMGGQPWMMMAGQPQMMGHAGQRPMMGQMDQLGALPQMGVLSQMGGSMSFGSPMGMMGMMGMIRPGMPGEAWGHWGAKEGVRGVCADESIPACADASEPVITPFDPLSGGVRTPPTCSDGSTPVCADGSAPQRPEAGDRHGLGNGEFKEGGRVVCADESIPACADGSEPVINPFDPRSAEVRTPPTCANGSTPVCADGSAPQRPEAGDRPRPGCADKSAPVCADGSEPIKISILPVDALHERVPPTCEDGSTPVCADGSAPEHPMRAGGFPFAPSGAFPMGFGPQMGMGGPHQMGMGGPHQIGMGGPQAMGPQMGMPQMGPQMGFGPQMGEWSQMGMGGRPQMMGPLDAMPVRPLEGMHTRPLEARPLVDGQRDAPATGAGTTAAGGN